MTIRTTGTRWLVGAFLGLVVVTATPSGADAASPCAPGQPPGRPPGRPTTPPGQPPGRPPEYPPGQCQLQLSRSAAAGGSTVTAAGSGFTAASTVALSLDGRALGNATTDRSGAFSTSVTIPSDMPAGSFDMTAVGPDEAGGTRVLSAAFTVLEESAAGAGAQGADLPRTGSSATSALLYVAVGLVVVGASAAVVGRRRRPGPRQEPVE